APGHASCEAFCHWGGAALAGFCSGLAAGNTRTFPLIADLPGTDRRAVSLARVLFTFRQLGVAPGRAEVVDEAPRVAHADVGRWFPVGEGRGATLQRRRCRTRPAVRVRPHGREQRRAA